MHKECYRQHLRQPLNCLAEMLSCCDVLDIACQGEEEKLVWTAIQLAAQIFLCK